jgi:flagellar motility protein MotE (MotC chaperone)
MPAAANRSFAIGALLLAALFAGPALAQSDAKLKPAAGAPDKSADSGVARYCANVAPLAAEARVAMQAKRLSDLEAQIRQRIDELDKKEAEARDWVTKREALINKANDDVVAIYGKMEPEAAAAQLAALDDATAVSVLSKLKVNAASAILNEMDAAQASRLTGIMSGAVVADKKM